MILSSSHHRLNPCFLVPALLNLFRDDYKEGIRKASIIHGSSFFKSLSQVEYLGESTYISPLYWLLSSKTSTSWVFVRVWYPGFYWIELLVSSSFFSIGEGDIISGGLGINLRDLLLQEPIDAEDFEGALPELVGCVCDELLYGVSSASRTLAYKLLFNLYQLPAGMVELNRLGRPGKCMHELVARVLKGHIITLDRLIRP